MTFGVSASGTALAYQWLQNNSPLANQTNSTMTAVATTNAQFVVVVTNLVGAVTSNPVSLTVESGAAFLDATAFQSLGVFDAASDVVVDIHSGLMSGGAGFQGIYIHQGGAAIRVFVFSSFTLSAGVHITFSNASPNVIAVAFLSQGDMTINGSIDASGEAGSGPDANGPGSGVTGGGVNGGGGGGGSYGGEGAFGEYGAAPGGVYNSDLTAELEGGSAGGGGSTQPGGAGGGGGGGALQIVSEGTLNVTGVISVNGGDGGAGNAFGFTSGGGGGGSGGGLLVQADNVNISSNAVLSANGGDGGPAGAFSPNNYWYGGGGGGGGRIVVSFANYGMNLGSITAGAGSGNYPGGNGSPGTVIFAQQLDGSSATDRYRAAKSFRIAPNGRTVDSSAFLSDKLHSSNKPYSRTKRSLDARNGKHDIGN